MSSCFSLGLHSIYTHVFIYSQINIPFRHSLWNNDYFQRPLSISSFTADNDSLSNPIRAKMLTSSLSHNQLCDHLSSLLVNSLPPKSLHVPLPSQAQTPNNENLQTSLSNTSFSIPPDIVCNSLHTITLHLRLPAKPPFSSSADNVQWTETERLLVEEQTLLGPVTVQELQTEVCFYYLHNHSPFMFFSSVGQFVQKWCPCRQIYSSF